MFLVWQKWERRNINTKIYVSEIWCEVWYELLILLILQEEKMSPSHTIQDNQSDRHTDTTHIYVNPLHVMKTKLLRDLINRVVFTRMCKRSAIVSTQHVSNFQGFMKCMYVCLRGFVPGAQTPAMSTRLFF